MTEKDYFEWPVVRTAAGMARHGQRPLEGEVMEEILPSSFNENRKPYLWMRSPQP
jgi:hypothetical protein